MENRVIKLLLGCLIFGSMALSIQAEETDTKLGEFCRQNVQYEVFQTPTGDRYSVDPEGRMTTHGSDVSFSEIVALEHGVEGRCEENPE